MGRKNFLKVQSNLRKRFIASSLSVALAASMVNCSNAGAVEENEQLPQIGYAKENIQDDKRKLSERFPDLKLGHINNIDNIRGDFSKFKDDFLKNFLLKIDEKYNDISKEFPKTTIELLVLAHSDSKFLPKDSKWDPEKIKKLSEDKLPKIEELIFGIFVYLKNLFPNDSLDGLLNLLKDNEYLMFKSKLKTFIEKYYKELYLAINELHGIEKDDSEESFEYKASDEILAMCKKSKIKKEYGGTKLFYVIGIIVAILFLVLLYFLLHEVMINKETTNQGNGKQINDTDNKNTAQNEQGESSPKGEQFFNTKSGLLITAMGTVLSMSVMYLMDKKAKIANCSNKENITNKQLNSNFGKTITKDKTDDSDLAIEGTDVDVQTGYGESKEGKNQQR